ncbi:hypothetical protein [Helicobacter suis]|uniref:hypothetical protein n=1 Tax=Helicobacter suis TaxID=104628 RepID=UPI0013D2C8B4|nr:hypothetical protein [Helicobacter suis]
MYLILSFKKGGYTNLYQRIKQILQNFHSILKHYNAHVLALQQNPNSCKDEDSNLNGPACLALFMAYQQIKKQFHATSIKGSCDVPNRALLEVPKNSKKMGNTGTRKAFSFVLRIKKGIQWVI